MNISDRFRGFLPIVIDLETAGLDSNEHALLELAAVVIDMQGNNLYKKETLHYHIKPFEGAKIDPQSLKINGIQPNHPLRIAQDESKVIPNFLAAIEQHVKMHHCKRAIMVAHNAMFDMSFLNAAIARNKLKKSPFHSFSFFDTVTLGGVMTGQTVLSRIAQNCGLDYDEQKAHGAKYDAELTADIFCLLCNKYGLPSF